MSINFDKALGIHEKALNFRAQRAEVLANNISNADTPGYKARDLDFSKVLAAETEKVNSKGQFAMNTTNGRHIEAQGAGSDTEGVLLYRTPSAPSLDQNTVDSQVEQASYAQNSMSFQASFTLLNNKFKGLVAALRGE